MLQCKVKPGKTQYLKTTIFRNPKCGHRQEFDYTTPFMCQDLNCKEKLPQIDRLCSDTGQSVRVKYFAEGKI